MKALVAAPILALLVLAAPVSGTHAQAVSQTYPASTLVAIEGNHLGLSWCITYWATGGAQGCLGGGEVHTHEPGGVGQAADDCSDPELCHTYLKATLGVTDVVSGPNVYAINCLQNPAGGIFCGYQDPNSATYDGTQDADVAGCGIALPADATGIHTGNHHVVSFVFAVSVDATTSQVCAGTSGVMTVLFF